MGDKTNKITNQILKANLQYLPLKNGFYSGAWLCLMHLRRLLNSPQTHKHKVALLYVIYDVSSNSPILSKPLGSLGTEKGTNREQIARQTLLISKTIT